MTIKVVLSSFKSSKKSLVSGPNLAQLMSSAFVTLAP